MIENIPTGFIGGMAMAGISGKVFKSAYQIAKEVGVTPQALYKRLTNTVLNQLADHMQRGEGKQKGYRFDEEGERAIKALFGVDDTIQPTIEPDIQPFGEHVGQPVGEPLYNIMQGQLDFLRSQNDMLQHRNTELTNQLVELTKNMVELTRNNQLLLGMEKQPKLPFWRRIFVRSE